MLNLVTFFVDQCEHGMFQRTLERLLLSSRRRMVLWYSEDKSDGKFPFHSTVLIKKINRLRRPLTFDRSHAKLLPRGNVKKRNEDIKSRTNDLCQGIKCTCSCPHCVWSGRYS